MLLSSHYECTFVFIADRISSHKKLIVARNGISNAKTFFLERSQILQLRRLASDQDIVINAGINEVSVLLALLKGRKKFSLYNWWGGTMHSEANISMLRLLSVEQIG